jgi:hypothetical protein
MGPKSALADEPLNQQPQLAADSGPERAHENPCCGVFKFPATEAGEMDGDEQDCHAERDTKCGLAAVEEQGVISATILRSTASSLT